GPARAADRYARPYRQRRGAAAVAIGRRAGARAVRGLSDVDVGALGVDEVRRALTVGGDRLHTGMDRSRGRGGPSRRGRRRDRVAVDLELAPLLRERLRQADDRRLRRGVVRLAGIPHRAGDRGDVDDLAEDLAALLALLLRRLAQMRRGRADDAERHD